MESTDSIVASQALANEVELKRKVRGLERTKVNHLLRQLQLRLQYARLKVDHGWQKQRLNEVENLYFHQNKQGSTEVDKPPRQNGTGYPSTALLTAPLDPQLLASYQAQSDEPNSSLSFKLGSSALYHIPTTDDDTLEPSKRSVPSTPQKDQQMAGSSQPMVPPSGLFLRPVNPRPNLINPWLKVSTPRSNTDGIVSSSAAQQQGSSSPSNDTTNQPRLAVKAAPPSNPALTYDSFWSSHSTAVSVPKDGGTASSTSPTPASPTASRNGKGKGKARVVGGSISKRKSPPNRASVRLEGYH
ncbi:hypothetical protein C8J57DRAFT_447190 [Mycena rebaudengoi]|nr:hypothetical protein C8J57DRAFT_64945 [Mycena rebaudengoi]KAJ7263117.1 hypothetical protein C8J57DRAFT_447190 [Mycena rebaudengoi]